MPASRVTSINFCCSRPALMAVNHSRPGGGGTEISTGGSAAAAVRRRLAGLSAGVAGADGRLRLVLDVPALLGVAIWLARCSRSFEVATEPAAPACDARECMCYDPRAQSIWALHGSSRELSDRSVSSRVDRCPACELTATSCELTGRPVSSQAVSTATVSSRPLEQRPSWLTG